MESLSALFCTVSAFVMTAWHIRPLSLLLQTDIYGTCMSHYERRGHVLVKARSLQQCHQRRVSEFWQQSVGLKDDNVSHRGLPYLQNS